MSILENIEYNKIVGSLVVGATLISPLSSDDSYSNIQLLHKASYDKYTDYSSPKQSTIADSLLKNDVEMIKIVEISNIVNIIKEKYATEVISTWLPADGNLDKLCLFVSLKNQNELKSQYEDLEVDLFLTLEDTFKHSKFFNMIALM